jgi:ABC-type multidrug transport system ATPase subunit
MLPLLMVNTHLNLMLKLNLKKCENTVIGSVEKNIKGISGGEKRRLAFACEVRLVLQLITVILI